MKWHESKLEHMRTRKLHHRAYKRALSDLQTELTFSDPGEVVVLTGPSRMGKTSVLERLEREYLESSGNDSMTEYPFVYVEAKNRANEGRFSCQQPPAKAGGLLFRLKAGFIGRSADLHHIEVIIWLRWLLILDVLLPHLIGHVPARCHPVAPCPQMLAPVPFLQAPELR